MEDYKIKIGKRIETALALSGKKQKDLAEYLDILPNTISYFCKGTRTPNTEQIIKIAQFLNVSADYLLGLSDNMTIDIDIQTACKVTGLSEKAVENLNSINILYAPIMIGFIDELICDFDHKNQKGALESIFNYLLFNSQLLGKVNFEFKSDDTFNLKLPKQELDNSKREILAGMIDKILIESIERDLNKIRSEFLEKLKEKFDYGEHNTPKE